LNPRSIDHRPPVETALVLHPVRSSGHASASAQTPREPALRLDEAIGLAQALDLEIKGADLVPLRAPTPATLFGKGKVAEIGERCAEAAADNFAHCSVGQNLGFRRGVVPRQIGDRPAT